jgi:integrase
MEKPEKPYKEFPLYAHRCGQWVKKINQKLWYFGSWSDPDGAIEKYKREIDDIRAGRDPRRMAIQGEESDCALVDLVNAFLSSKKSAVRAGRLSARMFDQYHEACGLMIKHLGRTVKVAAIGPRDFSALLASFPRTWGLSMIAGYVGRIRAVFLFGYETDLLSVPAKFGPDFVKPSKAEHRRERAVKVTARGRLSFEAAECQTLLKETRNVQLKACILLGLNAGFGNTDCSTLTQTSLQLDRGWLDFPRPKTGIERRVPLWSETIEAIRKAILKRKAPAEPEFADRVFLTREGRPLVWDKTIDGDGEVEGDGEGKKHRYYGVNNLSLTFGRLLRKCKLHKAGHNFYSLRRTFETVASGTKDQVAVNLIMGHEDSSMAAVYRQGIDDVRLTEVVQYVHKWLYGSKSDSNGG